MASFYQVGKQVINLDNVAYVQYVSDNLVIVYFNATNNEQDVIRELASINVSDSEALQLWRFIARQSPE